MVSDPVRRPPGAVSAQFLWQTPLCVVAPAPELHLLPQEQLRGPLEMLAQCSAGSAGSAALQSRGEGESVRREVMESWWMMVE